MSSVNKVIIVGRLGNDPEVRSFQNGGGVTNISVATSERWTDKNTGERREQTEWHRISLFNRLGEIAAQYLRKGSMVYIEGSLQTRKYTDQQGIERFSTEIRASEMRMLSSNSDNNGGGFNNPNYNNGGAYPNNNQWNNQARSQNAYNDYNQGGQYGANQPNYGNQGYDNQHPNAQFQNGFANQGNQNSQSPAMPSQNSNTTSPSQSNIQGNNMAQNSAAQNSFGTPPVATPPKADTPPAAQPASAPMPDDDIPF